MKSLGAGKVVRIEMVRKQFNWGMSVLSAYLKYNKKKQYSDINIISQGFVRDLLNNIYACDFRLPTQDNNSCYDLISKGEKTIVKVLTQFTWDTIDQTFEALNRRVDWISDEISKLLRIIDDANKSINNINNIIFSSEKNCLASSLEIGQLHKQNSFARQDKERNTKIEEYKSIIDKCKETIENIEDIRGYNIVLFVFTSERPVVDSKIKLTNIPNTLQFDFDKNVWSLMSIADEFGCIQEENEEQIKKICELMNGNPKIFTCSNHENDSIHSGNEVVNEYAKNFESPLFLHTYDKQAREKVTLKNLFVEPHMYQITGVKADNISCNDNGGIVAVLDKFIWDCEKDRILFIDGDAAIGKTSLISWLCYHYKKMDEIGKAIFLNSYLICIRLRDLSFPDNTDDLIIASILKYLGFESMNLFESIYWNAVIILEGVDELGIINMPKSLSVEQFVSEFRHAFKFHKIIITCRTKYIDMDEMSKKLQAFSYQHYCLKHFSAKQRIEWINNYETENKGNQHIYPETKKYIEEMDDEEASGVADTPLALYLLVSCDVTMDLRCNKWALYYKIFHDAIRNVPYNESFCDVSEGDGHKILKNNDLSEEIYRIVGNIANKMFSNNPKEQYYITDCEFDDIISNSKGKWQREAIKKCCVLSSYWNKSSNRGALEFYHNNIRDFFMCEFIYSRFYKIIDSNYSDNSIRKFIRLACEIFQYGIIAKTTWEQTFTFLYNKMNSEECDVYTIEQKRNKQMGLKLFNKVLNLSLYGHTMWQYRFSTPAYSALKATLHNYLIFLRIWFSPVTPIPMSYDLRDYNHMKWYDNDMFRDWSSIFSNCIEIGRDAHISFFSGVEFSCVYFNERDLYESCFEGSKFVNSKFIATNLAKSNFSKARLENVDFNNSNLSQACFDDATIINVDFSEACLTGASFERATIISTNFTNEIKDITGISLDGVKFERSTIDNIDLGEAPLSGVSLSSCYLKNVIMPRQISKAEFIDCMIDNCVFFKCENLEFKGLHSKIQKTRFKELCSRTSFNSVTICGGSWSSATLDNVQFENSEIKDLVLSGSKVIMAKFTKCKIEGPVDAYQANIPLSVLEELIRQADRVIY